MSRTLSLEEAAEEIGAPSPNWVRKQILRGRITGRKIGRHWRMTQQDVDDALEVFRSGRAPQPVQPIGLSAASLRRRSA